MKELIVLNMLHRGVSTGRDLARAAKTHEAAVRAFVNKFRSIGIPVCASRKGYYISEDPEEIQKTIDSLQHRINQMQKAVDGLRQAMKGADQ